MAIEFQCTGCRQWYAVPERAAGRTVTCPQCSESMLVPEPTEVLAAAPMILDDDEDEDLSESVTEPDLPHAHFLGSVANVEADAAPPESIIIQTATKPKPARSKRKPEVAPVPPEKRIAPTEVPKEVVFDDEHTTKAMLLSRPALVNYVLAGVIVAGLLAITVLVTIQKERLLNPLPMNVSRQISPSPQALAWLGERKSSFLYSFQLPENYQPASARPSVDGFPKNTIAHAWEAQPGGNDAGSSFAVWVIPKVYDLEEKLEEMNNLQKYVGYPTAIEQRSAHARIGEDMICVQGIVDGSSYELSRKGVIYLISHEDRTIMIIAMAVGPSSRQGQAILNAAAGTIELNAKSEA